MVGAARGPPGPAPALRTAASRKRRLAVPETETRRPGNGDSPSRKRRLAVLGTETRRLGNGDSPSWERRLAVLEAETRRGETYDSPGWIVRLTGGVEAGAPGRVELGELATARQERRRRAVLDHPAVGHDEHAVGDQHGREA